MEVKALKRFIDASIKKAIEAGEVVEMPEGRAQELAKIGFVEIVKGEVKEKTKVKKTKKDSKK